MHRFCWSMAGPLVAGMIACVIPASVSAGIPGGVALVLGATIHPAADSLSLPNPRSPDDLVRTALPPGLYDVWFYFFSREPLVGAWTIDLAFEFDRRPGHGIDIEKWECLSDRYAAAPGWPNGGVNQGIRLEWNRPDCFDRRHHDLFRGRNGWFRQAALRLSVRVYDPDALRLADPEPGVPAQVVQCYDDDFRLDGEDGWTLYAGPTFMAADSAAISSGDPSPRTTVVETSWGGIKVNFGGAGRNQ